MYKIEFKPKTFLYDQLKYYEDEGVEPQLSYIEDYEHESLQGLISIYGTWFENGPSEERTLRLEVLRNLILKELNAVDIDRYHFMLEMLTGELEELNKRIKELSKNFKNHRHDTTKSYSEKPSW